MLFRSWKSMVAQDPAFEIWEEPEEIPEESSAAEEESLVEKLEGIREEIRKQGKIHLRSSTLAQSERESLKEMMGEILSRFESQRDKPPIGFLQDLFPIADGLEEAINVAESLSTSDPKLMSWANSIRITYQRLLGELQSHVIKLQCFPSILLHSISTSYISSSSSSSISSISSSSPLLTARSSFDARLIS